VFLLFWAAAYHELRTWRGLTCLSLRSIVQLNSHGVRQNDHLKISSFFARNAGDLCIENETKHQTIIEFHRDIRYLPCSCTALRLRPKSQLYTRVRAAKPSYGYRLCVLLTCADQGPPHCAARPLEPLDVPSTSYHLQTLEIIQHDLLIARHSQRDNKMPSKSSIVRLPFPVIPSPQPVLIPVLHRHPPN
jgi:hypothetical protein